MSAHGPRIAVVGLGAIGSAVAAALADVGQRVIGCTRTAPPGLQVHHPGGTSRPNFPIRTRASEVEPVDWVLLATKAHQSAAAAKWLHALSDERTQIAVLQNGIDQEERVRALLPTGGRPAGVMPVIVQLPAERVAAGEIRVDLDGVLTVPDTSAGRAFERLFEGARTRAQVAEDFVTQAWWKLLANAAMGGVCALAATSNDYVLEPGVHAITLALMDELIAVSRAEGARLPDDAGERAIQIMTRAAGRHRSSIVVDRIAGRPMEWEARNAVVGRLGRRHGIATPLNDAVTHLLEAIDSSAAERQAPA